MLRFKLKLGFTYCPGAGDSSLTSKSGPVFSDATVPHPRADSEFTRGYANVNSESAALTTAGIDSKAVREFRRTTGVKPGGPPEFETGSGSDSGSPHAG